MQKNVDSDLSSQTCFMFEKWTDDERTSLLESRVRYHFCMMMLCVLVYHAINRNSIGSNFQGQMSSSSCVKINAYQTK